MSDSSSLIKPTTAWRRAPLGTNWSARRMVNSSVRLVSQLSRSAWALPAKAPVRPYPHPLPLRPGLQLVGVDVERQLGDGNGGEDLFAERAGAIDQKLADVGQFDAAVVLLGGDDLAPALKAQQPPVGDRQVGPHGGSHTASPRPGQPALCGTLPRGRWRLPRALCRFCDRRR